MTELNGREYAKWEDYIYDRFPGTAFDISEDRSTTSAKIITVTSKALISKTRIVFDFPATGLCRVCFYNPDSPLHNANNDNERLRSLMYTDFELTAENLAETDEYLKIPVNYGWTEQATYYKGKQLKSELLYHNGVLWQSVLIDQNFSWFDKAGCLLTLLAWPVIYIHYKVVKSRLYKNNQDVVITKAAILPMLPE